MMREKATRKLIIFAVSIAFFALGVYAVYMEDGTMRTTLLAVALAGLLAVALRQTILLRKKGN